MANVRCPSCHRPISDERGLCPYCGTLLARGRPDASDDTPGTSDKNSRLLDEADYSDDIAASQRPIVPRWPYYVFLLYLVLIAGVFFIPVAMAAANGNEVTGLGLVIGGLYFLLVGLGVSLMAVPIKRDWFSPVKRGSIVWPLIGSVITGLLLLGGAVAASYEFWPYEHKEPGDTELLMVLSVGAALAWGTWFVILCYCSRSVDRTTLSGRLAFWLLAGSLLELLVAIPMHMVVRRRGECSTGLLTGFGIGMGIFVMLVALGPAVFFLCYRRYRQVYARKKK